MNAPHDFSAVVRDCRDVRFDEAYDRCVAQLLAADEKREQANLLIRRNAIARQRQYAAEPVCITGFGALDSPRIRAFIAHEDEPHVTPAQRAEQDYQDFRELQAKEQRHFGET